MPISFKSNTVPYSLVPRQLASGLSVTLTPLYHTISPAVEYDQLMGRDRFVYSTNTIPGTFAEQIIHGIKIYFIFLFRTVS